MKIKTERDKIYYQNLKGSARKKQSQSATSLDRRTAVVKESSSFMGRAFSSIFNRRASVSAKSATESSKRKSVSREKNRSDTVASKTTQLLTKMVEINRHLLIDSKPRNLSSDLFTPSDIKLMSHDTSDYYSNASSNASTPTQLTPVASGSSSPVFFNPNERKQGVQQSNYSIAEENRAVPGQTQNRQPHASPVLSFTDEIQNIQLRKRVESGSNRESTVNNCRRQSSSIQNKLNLVPGAGSAAVQQNTKQDLREVKPTRVPPAVLPKPPSSPNTLKPPACSVKPPIPPRPQSIFFVQVQF
jgi:hypothetical protein